MSRHHLAQEQEAISLIQCKTSSSPTGEGASWLGYIISVWMSMLWITICQCQTQRENVVEKEKGRKLKYEIKEGMDWGKREASKYR